MARTAKTLRIISLFLLFLIIMPLAGCRDQAVDGTLYTVTDVQGETVAIRRKPTKILTLSMSTDIMMLGLVEPERMVAVNALLDDPVSSNVVDLAARVEKRVGFPNVEEIIALQPDIVIVPDWGNLDMVAPLRDAGLTVVVCKGTRTLSDIEETIVLLSEAVGERERGDDLLRQMRSRLDGIEVKVSLIPTDARPRVVLISLMTTYGGSGSLFDEMCRYAGVINARAAIGIRDGEAMSKEQLVAASPDVLFLPTYNNYGAFDVMSYRAQFLADPALSTLPAIKSGRLVEPNESYIYNASQDFVLGVQEIAYRVYGNEFAQPAGEHLTAVGTGN